MLCHCNLMKPSRFILLFSLKSCFIYSSKGDSYTHSSRCIIYVFRRRLLYNMQYLFTWIKEKFKTMSHGLILISVKFYMDYLSTKIEWIKKKSTLQIQSPIHTISKIWGESQV